MLITASVRHLVSTACRDQLQHKMLFVFAIGNVKWTPEHRLHLTVQSDTAADHSDKNAPEECFKGTLCDFVLRSV